MGKLAECYVEIGSKTAGFDSGLARTEKGLNEFVSRANSMLATIGVGVGAAGLARMFADAAAKAGDMAETMSKVDAVFGKSKDSVLDMAEGMADRFGAVKQTTLDAASMFGLIAQGAGMSEKEAASLSVRLTRLADDASSFYNTSLDVALEKIRAGLVGESEPLRAFGVMLSESAVQSKALAMGLASSAKELDDQAKVAARAQLIMEGLSKATGDHERTLGSLNNQLKKFRGEWENFKVEVGRGFMEAATPELARLNAFASEARREGVGAAIWDYVASQFKVAPGSIADSLIGDRLRASQERREGPFLPSTLEPLTKPPEAAQAAVRAAFGAFRGGGFGAFGMMGQLGQMLNAGPGAELLKLRPRESSARMDVAEFGAMAIQKSLEGPSGVLEQIKQEQVKANDKLGQMLDQMKIKGPRPGVFPARRR